MFVTWNPYITNDLNDLESRHQKFDIRFLKIVSNLWRVLQRIFFSMMKTVETKID